MRSRLDDKEAAKAQQHPGNQPDEIVKCPYFPEHELRKSRLVYHIIKCQNNPQAPKLLICPYNFLHRVTKEDRESHLILCQDKPKSSENRHGMPSYNKTLKTMDRHDIPKAKSFHDGVSKPDGEEEWWG